MNMLRPDLAVVASLVPPHTKVLDVGCGDGDLLAYLEAEKGCDARGIELIQDGVHTGVARGLSIVQGDADTDLLNYPADGFDVAILSQSLQAMRNPKAVLAELSRIAPCVIISIPNFGYWRVRLSLLLNGRMPVSPELPRAWYDTPNIHLCTIADFVDLARSLDLRLQRLFTLNNGTAKERAPTHVGRINLTAAQAIFLATRA